MPAAARRPSLAPRRRKTRQIKVGKVRRRRRRPDRGAVDDDDARPPTSTRRCSRSPSSPRPAATSCGSPARARTTPTRCRRSPSKSQIPVIADIHFQPKYVFAAIDAGCAAVRVNPGNIRKFDDQVKEIAQAAKDARRLDPDRRQRRLARHAAARRSTARRRPRRSSSRRSGRRRCSRSTTSTTSRSRSSTTTRWSWSGPTSCSPRRGDWPLHLGVTEAGPAFQGTIKSAVAFGALLGKGIGDTIRVSLSAPPVEEVKVGIQILQSLNLRPRKLEIVSCPSCGRAQVDVYKLAERGHRRPRGHGGAAARRRHGLRRQRPGRGPRGRPRRRLRQRQGPDLRHAARSSRPCPRRRSSRP